MVRRVAGQIPRSVRDMESLRSLRISPVGVLLLYLLGSVQGQILEKDPQVLRRVYPVWEPKVVEVKGLGEPLVLTKFLEPALDDLEAAREMARVTYPPIASIAESYSGYLTVDPKYNSNLFFWFFPAQNGDPKSPLLLWLQGGPGATSLFGLFTEIGPFTVEPNNTLKENPYSWHKNYSLLFIDNPVGTGFSFTGHKNGFCKKQEQIGEHLYTALIQFFKLFPEFQPAPFFITGESYAGKHIPSVAYVIHKKNPKADLWINLKGLAIGNAFADPETMSKHSEFIYQLGLVDTLTYKEMQLRELYLQLHLAEKNYTLAYMDSVINQIMYMTNSNFSNVYHAMKPRGSSLEGLFVDFVQEPQVRVALHVGETEFTSIGEVYTHLVPDFMTSSKAWIEELLEDYRVMLFSGQLDIIVAYPLSVQMYESMRFTGSQKYRLSKRRPWFVGGELAGYVKKGGNFYDVMVRNAGHMVPTDQPIWALDLIDKFITNTLVIIGDALHNLTDGLAVGAAFRADIAAGFATAVAVLTHELPHELGDFAVLLKSGMSIKKAVYFNIFSSIISFIGMAGGIYLGNFDNAAHWIYAATAGSFLYIGLADLVPELHKYRSESNSKVFCTVLQLCGAFTGGAIMFIIAIYEDSLYTMFRLELNS